MCRAVTILLSLLPVSCLSQDIPKLPIEPPRWALLSLTQEDKLIGEVVIGSQPEVIRQEYEVKVPYQTTNPDGTKSLAFKTESRIKDITFQKPITKKLTLNPSEMLFADPKGNRMNFESEVRGKLNEPMPVLILTKAWRHPVYEALLKPETIIAVVPEEALPLED
jgi:hypothetical protein